MELNKLKFISYSFFVGVLLSSIPYLVNLNKRIRQYKMNQIEIENLRLREEERCKGKDSLYRKYFNLGFPETAKDEFNKCVNFDLDYTIDD